jgi:hypothetical protein
VTMRPAGLCASFLPDSFNNRQCLLSQYILSVRFAYLSPTTWFRRVNNGRVVRSSTPKLRESGDFAPQPPLHR